ncbi:hypothetical protein F5888DRAFT_1630545 [Russula emetica]|nr:hypothetical protein F5888DRAFT_1630545 [Russula emetica]
MSGIALGAAYAAVQLVHQAYSKVKTSKERCARLVGRCQFVIDRLERIAATTGGDSIIRERIYELERAFEQTALTIVQVGRQGIIASLLRAEANALRIEACNEALTELISLFNLEEIVDVRRWQTDLEVARVHDHHELLNMGNRIENDNAAINRELVQQGATIAQVLRGIHDINAGLQNAQLNRETLKIAIPLTIADALALSPPPPTTLTSRRGPDTRNLNMGMGMESRLWLPTPSPTPLVTGSGTLASGPSTLYIPCASPRTAAKPRSLAQRRLTFARKCVNMVPLTKVFSSKLSSSSLPSTAPKANVVKRDAATGERPQEGDSGSSVSSCDHPLPVEPPPPYQLRVANPAPAPAPASEASEYDYDYDHNIHAGRGAAAAAAMSSSSRFTAASVEAIRAPDSPVPTFPSPKLSTESVFGGSTRSLGSVSDRDSECSAPANTNGTLNEARARYIRTLRNSAARGGAGPALRRKNTIGFARRITLSSSSGYHSVKRTVSSTPPFRS